MSNRGALPQNASITDTNAQMTCFERKQLQGNNSVEHWSTHGGTGAPRFVLSFDLQTANNWFGQQVIVAIDRGTTFHDEKINCLVNE